MVEENVQSSGEKISTTKEIVPDIPEEIKVGEVVNRFVQRAQFSAFERILCSHLIEAISGDPTETIVHICRAAQTLDEDQLEALEIDPEEVNNLYAVVTTILSARANVEDQAITLFLDTLDWTTQLAPWVRKRAYLHTPVRSVDWENLGGIEWFFMSCRYLAPAGFEHLKADFLLYAMPRIQQITRKLSSLVSPSTYNEILSVFKTSSVPSSEE